MLNFFRLTSSNLLNSSLRSFSTKVTKPVAAPATKPAAKGTTAQATAGQPQKQKKRLLLGRPGNTLKMGIVGLANVGKSSTFNFLSKLNVPAENYPFCTIDPNTAHAMVPDERFDHLCKMWAPKKEIRPTLEIIDIAGLVPGASEGLGLGNAFLSHIQSVDGIFHVVRAFDDPRIAHTEGRVDPLKDMEIISDELIKKDQQLLVKKLATVERKAHDKKAKDEHKILLKVKELFSQKKWVKDFEWEEQDVQILNTHLFFTAKPVIYLINMSAEDYISGKNKYLDQINQWMNDRVPGVPIPYSVEYENNKELIEKNGGKSVVKDVIYAGYKCLDLVYYFTAGEDEVRAWTLRSNTKAPQASALIHTDFERGFQGVEVVKYADFLSLGNQGVEKYKSKVKVHGKEYMVEDGDICVFKINTKVIKK